MMRDDLNIPLPGQGSGIGGRYGQRSGSAMDPQIKRMGLIAGGIAGGLLLVVGAWSAIGHRSTGVPVVEADSRPLREKPADQGGAAGGDEAILSGEKEGRAVVSPAPETPKIAALKSTPPAPLPAQTASVQTASAQSVSTQSASSQTGLAQAPQPASSSQGSASSAVSSGRQIPPAAASGAQVQLAALPSEEAATAEWQRLSKRFPDLLGGKQPALSRIERDGKIFWRLRTGGFADVASATGFCGQVRAKGASCSLATF